MREKKTFARLWDTMVLVVEGKQAPTTKERTVNVQHMYSAGVSDLPFMVWSDMIMHFNVTRTVLLKSYIMQQHPRNH